MEPTSMWERDLIARVQGVRVRYEYDLEAYKQARGLVRWFPEFTVRDLSEIVDCYSKYSTVLRRFVMESLVDRILSGGSVELTGSGGLFTHGEDRNEDATWATISQATDADELKALEVMARWEQEKHPQGESRRSRTSRSEPSFRVLKLDAAQALPRQARVILQMLADAGGSDASKSFSQTAVDGIMQVKAELLKTKQPPERIFAFYKNRLVAEKYLEEVGPTSSKEDDVDETSETTEGEGDDS